VGFIEYADDMGETLDLAVLGKLDYPGPWSSFTPFDRCLAFVWLRGMVGRREERRKDWLPLVRTSEREGTA
jgi:hypothetical protein